MKLPLKKETDSSKTNLKRLSKSLTILQTKSSSGASKIKYGFHQQNQNLNYYIKHLKAHIQSVRDLGTGVKISVKKVRGVKNV